MIATFIGIWLGVIVEGVFMAIGPAIVALFSNSWIGTIRVFGKAGRRKKDEDHYTWSKDKFTLLPILVLNMDMDEGIDAKYKRLTIAMYLVNLVLAGIYSFFILYFFWKNPRFGPRILRNSAIMVLGTGIISLIRQLYITFIKGEDLASFTRSKYLALMSGATYEQMDMSIPDGMYEKGSRKDKVLYLHICYQKALWMKNFAALNNLVRQLDLALRKHGANSEYTYDTLSNFGYYDILFYSTYVNHNASHAVRIYNLIKPTLEADMDPNGRRVLAYYQFYVLKQAQMASITLNQAIDGLHNWDIGMDGNQTTKAEIEVERRLIEELQNNMTQALNPGTFTKPVIENTLDDIPLI
jgi:hypothetical protein